jgi:hypothetical protein
MPFEDDKSPSTPDMRVSSMQLSVSSPDHEFMNYFRSPRDLVGRNIFVKGQGEGSVLSFNKSHTGDSTHSVDFGESRGVQRILLRRRKLLRGSKHNCGMIFRVLVSSAVCLLIYRKHLLHHLS